jgi:hypothetical protein
VAVGLSGMASITGMSSGSLIWFLEEQTMSDKINHPEHYNYHPKGIECIDVVEDFSFNLGNAIKYIWRCMFTEKTIEDLRKAIWYIEREIQRLER